jgi:hypothetical protein
MSIRKRLFASFATVACALALTSSAAFAANGDCGQPVSNGDLPVATDCLYILRAAVGTSTCDPVCICDLNGTGGNPNATDALTCLNVSVGNPDLLQCDCGTVGPVAKDKCSVGEFVAAAGSDLDAGWNGAGHNASITEGASIFIEVVRRCGGDGDVCRLDSDCTGSTCDLTCDCDSATNTTCEVAGPVGNGHCLVAMQKNCTTNADCSSPGDGAQCVKFFGPPLPLSAEGTPTCITTYFQEDIAGTADTATGVGEASAFLRSRVHLGITLEKPCPRCGSLAQDPVVGDTFTCDGGPRNGQSCTVGAVSPDFGGTSTDCPPDSTSNVSGVGLAVKFNSVSTGTRAIDALLPCGGSLAALHPSNGGAVCLDTFASCSSNADCQRCTGDPTTACTSNADCTGNGTCAEAPDQPVSCGVYCHCGFCDGDPDAPCFSDAECGAGETCRQGTGATQQLQGNKCTDLTCGLGGFEQCCSTDDPSCANPTALVGECTDQPFRGCNNNTDCTNAGATGPCNLFNRPCFENQISRTGEPSPLGSYCVDDPNETTCTTNADCAVGNCVPDASEPTTVALFCVPPTASASINAAGGIPGPGAITFKSVIISYRCGNGVLEGIEQCDDGNNDNGDGCNEICENE